MKDILRTFIDYVQFHNFQSAKQIKKYLDEIIIQPRRQQKNEHKLLLKNQVRYKRAYNSGGEKVVSGMGYIVKVTKKKSQLSSMAISLSHHHRHQLKWTTYTSAIILETMFFILQITLLLINSPGILNQWIVTSQQQRWQPSKNARSP